MQRSQHARAFKKMASSIRGQPILAYLAKRLRMFAGCKEPVTPPVPKEVSDESARGRDLYPELYTVEFWGS
jgi:hypothetical protein